ncbi:uncharacterized protein I206_100089 [Kwoniella pini CBS 10737]|uniref:Uncharacterized protein n=1 Tax=Kwoniella pini CBS 10737 TaxID=1296096 RepID=A0A1B9IEE5_9TREE|nr:uncharacterized protein I206_01239 [Kwoniella pini CBS 10737]OCF53932.1 hypothetical protein I206_01239 [Kwoniella pini CBS 10737]
MDLGRPIGETAPTRGFDQGEHGAGTGLSGGYGEANASNTQAGKLAGDGFNAGLGGNYASGGIPSGTPIADQFSSQSQGTGKLDNSLDQYSGSGSTGYQGTSGGEAVSGAYEGSGTRDGLTGQSGAHTTGAGVGIGGENLTGSHGHHHGHHGHHEHGARDSALAGTAVGAGALAGSEAHSHHHSTAPLERGSGLAGQSGGLQPGIGGETGSGVGPSGGSGGHYTTGDSTNNSSGLGSGAGLAGAGAAGYGASQSGSSGNNTTSTGGPESSSTRAGTTSNPTSGSGGAGKYGRAEAHEGQGKPVGNPKDLDTGNSHSLVYDKATGEYTHRRDL